MRRRYYGGIDLITGLFAYFKFDGNIDSETINQPLLAFGTLAYSQGVIGQSLDNSVGNICIQASVVDGIVFDTSNGCTLSMNVKTSSNSQQYNMGSFGGSGGNVAITINAGKIYVRWGSNTFRLFTLSPTVNDGVWHKIVVRFNPNGTQDLFVDNNLIQSMTNAKGPNPNAYIYVAGVYTGGIAYSGACQYDDVRFYTIPLTDDKIMAL